jgi:sulfoxide reductase catalytic subunit YedY
MTGVHRVPLMHDPIEAKLSPADDRVLLNNWLPPQVGVVPKIRIGRRWINVLWALPAGFVLAVIGVAVAQALRELPAVQDFLVRYPGVPPSARIVSTGFPAWLRVQHFLNLFFMAFIIRAGIQILADHPRLYWKRDCTPGSERGLDRAAVPVARLPRR